tara:strand:+ start:4 stop:351 length:348 start_codon:yes stop_codon:yes gene_type:complete
VRHILILCLLFLQACTVDHDIPPIKVEKIEIEHKISPIVIKMPWGAEFMKADPNCPYVDQMANADMSDFCDPYEKYKYNCCEIDFNVGKNGCVIELCIEKYNVSRGCLRIVKGCI